jgi:rare lipoprotein A
MLQYHHRLKWLVLAGLCLAQGFPAAAAPHLETRIGYASFYGPNFHGKCCTANGETVNMHAHTAAHPSLPFGTHLKVTNLKNKKTVVVRINDRGPYHGGRIIDLSKGAFEQIARNERGVIKVQLEIVKANGNKISRISLPDLQAPLVRP